MVDDRPSPLMMAGMEIDPPVKRLLVFAIAIVVSTQAAILCSSGPAVERGNIGDRLEKAAELARQGDVAAGESYRKITIAFPEDVRGWIAYGNHLLACGDDAGAEAAFTSACAASEDRSATAPAWRKLGVIAWRHRRWQVAESRLAHAVAGQDLEALRLHALLLGAVFHRDDPEPSQRLLARSPDDPAVLLLVAGWKSLGGQRDEAAALCAHACTTARCTQAGLASASDAWVRYLAARLFAANGDADAAVACLSAAMDHDQRPPLERAHLLEDPAFAKASKPLAAIIASWPQRLATVEDPSISPPPRVVQPAAPPAGAQPDFSRPSDIK